jgi:hypothetical protein
MEAADLLLSYCGKHKCKHMPSPLPRIGHHLVTWRDIIVWDFQAMNIYLHTYDSPLNQK